MSDKTLPNLEGVATDDLASQIPGGNRGTYINWAATMHLLHVEANGWLPYLVSAPDGSYVHRAPSGGFLLIGFRHTDGTETPAVPQAVMDNKNKAIPYEAIDARDVTDTHRRGVCMAAALTFSLAYELWAKMELESGYRGDGAIEAIAACETLEELQALSADLATLKRKSDKDKARIAYLKREAELQAAAAQGK